LRPANLADIPDEFLDQVAALGFDYVWFLGLWQTGSGGRQVSLSYPEWLKEFQATLPDFSKKFGKAAGNSLKSARPGTTTTPGTASWPMPGKVRRISASSSQ
jgi:hypothetical protein